jgi:signal transduction histidine kinase
MTEISRLATLAADQQKSDFIGSVSHELRSPLHGILASCEFLGDTETTSFQKSLVDTADSCARTLLDTINMVLDYSKINAFERSASKARKKGRTLQSSLQDSSGKPQLNIYGDVNLASITEEVVEGVATGQIFKDNLNSFNDLDNSDIPDSSGHTFSARNEVEIIIDIVPRARAHDWVFVTQPGAFRRIIMNIFVSHVFQFIHSCPHLYHEVALDAFRRRLLGQEAIEEFTPKSLVDIEVLFTNLSGIDRAMP